MKTLILKILPLLLIGWAGLSHAQPINTTAGSITSCPGAVVVPVNVTNCNGVGAISLVLHYDDTRLTYTGYQNLHTALTTGLLIINNTGNKVVISWANTTAANIGNNTLVQLKFNAVPGAAYLNWDTQTPGNCEYSDVNGIILPSTYTNGTATIQQPVLINTQPTDNTVLVGSNTSFSVSAVATGLTHQWQISTNNGSTWADLANNATYSNVTGSILYLTSCQLTMNGYKYRCKLTGTCTTSQNTNEVTLTVVNPVTTTLPTISQCPGNMTVPVTVTNFTGVAAFSMVFSYNSSVLTYTGYQSVNPALSSGLMAVNASGGMVYITWSNNTAATIGSGTVIEILFTAATGTSPLNWDIGNEGHCEYTSLGGTQITSVWVNGSGTIYSLPAITGQPVNKTIAKGQNTSFGITATGSGIAYLWQISTNGGVSFTDLTNGGNYSGVTTSTLAVTNAQLAMSGYQYRCRVTGNCNPVAFSNPATLTVLPNIITNCGSLTGCPGQTVIPVTVTDFIGVASFSLTLNYNPAVLTFVNHQNLNAAVSGGMFSANAAGGKVYLTWSNTSAATIANGATLIELVFTGVPGSSTLSWDTQVPGNCEYSDINGLVIFSTWNNGSVTINTPPSVTTHPVNKTIYGGGSTSFSVAAAGTGLTYLWKVSTNGGSTWAPLANSPPYSGVFTNTLSINPASVSMNGYLYHCVVSGTCPSPQTSGSASLTVTQTAITTTTSGVSASCTGNLNVAVNVVNCSNVGSISLTLVYDTTKMSYEGYTQVNAGLSGGILAINRSLNKVYFTWAATSALNIGTAMLVNYRFKANPGISTTPSWDTQTSGACEYADVNGTVIASLYTNNPISVAANALVVNAGPDMVKTGASVQLNGSATGGITPYTWLWAPAGSLNNPAIANPVASPTVTTTYTLTVTATGGCTGSDMMDVIVQAVPENLSLQNITVGSGVNNCYNATNTITVAGSGTTFLVQNGGSATMIAGMKILYLPGTTVQSGGYMHGYITQSGQYCGSAVPPALVATGTGDDPRVEVNTEPRIFPNPFTSTFIVDIPDISPEKPATVMILNNMGKTICKMTSRSETETRFNLEGYPSGLYFVQIHRNGGQQTFKVIKR